MSPAVLSDVPEETGSRGAFERQVSAFRDRVSADGVDRLPG